MTQAEKELIIHRIIAGCLKCEVEDNFGKPLHILIQNPNKLQRYLAEEVYTEAFTKASVQGSYNDNEYACLMNYKKLWDEDKQGILDKLPKDIEELKIGLFNATFKSVQRNAIRKALVKARQYQNELYAELHEYDYLTAAGVAGMAKARYLVAASLHTLRGELLLDENDLLSAPDFLVEAAANIIALTKLNETQLREIARTEPWRTIWVSRKGESSVFGLPSVDLSEEQRMLSIWSTVYDNIHEHPDCPADEIINDDDMLDGWMLVQKRKRDSERGATGLDSFITNEKIRGCEEIFVPVDTIADAKKIENMNDLNSAVLKRKRMALAEQKGVVREQDMPDSKQKIQNEWNRLFMQHAHSKG